MINLPLIVERIKELMFDHNKTVNDLSSDLNIEASLIYRCLRGEGLLQTVYLLKIADYFSCSLDFVFGFENELYSINLLPYPPFGDRLVQLYNKKGLTEYRVMKDTNISRARLHDWRCNLRLPTPENLIILAHYFDCSLDYLIGRAN
jgi:transcriptional regulator with XRE-family HTH domain